MQPIFSYTSQELATFSPHPNLLVIANPFSLDKFIPPLDFNPLMCNVKEDTTALIKNCHVLTCRD